MKIIRLCVAVILALALNLIMTASTYAGVLVCDGALSPFHDPDSGQCAYISGSMLTLTNTTDAYKITINSMIIYDEVGNKVCNYGTTDSFSNIGLTPVLEPHAERFFMIAQYPYPSTCSGLANYCQSHDGSYPVSVKITWTSALDPTYNGPKFPAVTGLAGYSSPNGGPSFALPNGFACTTVR